MPIVNWNQERPLTLRCLGDAEYTFLPGPNEVPPEKWEALLDPKTGSRDPGGIHFFLRNKELEVMSQESIADLHVTGMKAAGAVAFIAKMVDVPTLERFKEEEENNESGARPEVMDALTNQLAAMKLTPPKKADLTTENLDNDPKVKGKKLKAASLAPVLQAKARAERPTIPRPGAQ